MKTPFVLSTLALVATLVVSGCGGSSSTAPTPTPTPTPAPSADVTISVVGNNGGNSFAPNPTTVTAGQSVTWKNNDNTVHRMVQDAPGFATADVAAGQTTSAVTLSTKGTITYHCSIHPSMTGTIVVQ